MNWLGCTIGPSSSVKGWTFNVNGILNCERLSPEGLENEAYELKSNGIVVRPTSSHLAYFSWTHFQEFGIDINIVGKHNKTTIIHHKVAARIVCIFSDKDIAAHVEQAHTAFLVPFSPPVKSGWLCVISSVDCNGNYRRAARQALDYNLTGVMNDIHDTLLVSDYKNITLLSI